MKGLKTILAAEGLTAAEFFPSELRVDLKGHVRRVSEFRKWLEAKTGVPWVTRDEAGFHHITDRPYARYFLSTPSYPYQFVVEADFSADEIRGAQIEKTYLELATKRNDRRILLDTIRGFKAPTGAQIIAFANEAFAKHPMPTEDDKIRAFFATLRTWFEPDSEFELGWTTRQNGEIGERAGAADVREGKRILQALRTQFPGVPFAIDIVDEWVSVFKGEQP